MRRTRRAVGVLAAGLMGLAAACATVREAPPVPARPPSPAELAMGYQEAVDASRAHLLAQGLADAELQAAEQLWPNLWRVRFGVVRREGRKVVEVHFDGARRTVVETVEQPGGEGTLSHVGAD